MVNNRKSATMEARDNSTLQQGQSHLLWIDGVGCWMLCTGDTVTIGGPSTGSSNKETANIRLMANLSRRHVQFQRQGEGYVIDPIAETRVNDRSIYEPTSLGNDYNLKLGISVELNFRIPTVLSSSAVIEFKSGHRPGRSIDGIVLMSDNCLLGSSRDNHVCCPDWESTLVLFKRDGQLCCKSRSALTINDKPVKDYATLESGSVISGEDLRFRIERIETVL